jgi:protein-S-isoprenylcysteine O-methyltransferase Ste14
LFLGAALALLGAASFDESLAIAGDAAGFLLVSHLFVMGYEEPTLRNLFGPAYDDYGRRVGRWR